MMAKMASAFFTPSLQGQKEMGEALDMRKVVQGEEYGKDAENYEEALVTGSG